MQTDNVSAVTIDWQRFGLALRLKRGSTISIRQAAEDIGVSFSVLGQWERGEVRPGAELFLRACRWLGVRAEEMIRDESIEPKGVA